MSSPLNDTLIDREVFAAACSSCAAISRTIGLPVARIRASRDAASTSDAMNADAHAGWALWPEASRVADEVLHHG